MLLLRQLTAALIKPTTSPQTFSQTISRVYAKRVGRKMTASGCKDMKQVHQETLRHVSPCARINIQSDIYVKVRAADVHEYPDGDVLIAELHGGHVRNSTASMMVRVSEDEQQVDVVLTRRTENTDFHAELEVPIRAALYINGKDSVSVQNMHSEEVCVQTASHINAKELNAGSITLCSERGNIKCEGRLLGQNVNLETKEMGRIVLDKLLGDKLNCRTEGGSISTNSCYVAASKFETDTGCLQLKNVHNRAEVYVHQKGQLQMTGVHGTLNVRSNGGGINLHLSELAGDSAIVASGVTEATVNISDEIEKSTRIEVTASGGIELDGSISHLQGCLGEDKHSFRLTKESDVNRLKLFVEGCGLKLGKLSWADTVRAAMSTAKVD